MTTDHMMGARRSVIESLGVYLPPMEVSTEDIMRGCVTQTHFPLERMSGIKSRHVAGDVEFSVDLAAKAVERCLAASGYTPEDVQLLISASVSRCDGPGLWLSFEPSTSLEIKRRFGFDNAVSFDVGSACSGMFAGINIVDTFIRRGVIQCGLVVSGEYISHLGKTAQKEITTLLDPRLACLTLGDAGAAVMLSATDSEEHGLEALDLATFGAYAGYCIGSPTQEAHGGAIMYTDALKLTAAATKHGAVSALETLERTGWTPEDFQHLIMHQTSSTALASAMREINRLMKRRVCHQGNTIDNLERRGNTASTSHFVALSDNLANGRIKSGDRVIFAISGSGITVGTALYTFDDLPDRLRTPSNGNISTHAVTKRTGRHVVRHSDARVRIESVGTALNNSGPRLDSLALLGRAADDCLTLSSHDRDTLDLLIYAGVYRTDFVCEPAIAAMLAGAQNINSSLASAGERRTLAFDVFNGGVGFLNACHVATEFVRSGKVATAMIASADVENNTDVFPDERLGIEESASAVVLDIAPGGRSGFGSFCFRSFTEHADGFSSHATNKEGRLYLHFSRAADLERHYVDGVASTVSDFLEANDLNIGSISRVFASQISASFLDCIGRALRIEQDRIVNAIPAGRDLLTSSIPFAFRQSVERAPAMPGEIGLVISAGSGVQIGCALYYF